jgi:hypothetical protein
MRVPRQTTQIVSLDYFQPGSMHPRVRKPLKSASSVPQTIAKASPGTGGRADSCRQTAIECSLLPLWPTPAQHAAIQSP